MQIKHYNILDSADLDVIRSWAEDADNRCYLISQGRVGAVTTGLCVCQPDGCLDIIARTERHLEGMIAATASPE